MNDLKGIVKDLSNSVLVDADFFLKLGLSDEEIDNSYSGCTTEGEILIMLKSQQQEITQLKAEKSGEWVSAGNGITARTICSNCQKEKNGLGYTKYCAECGAEMKKED